MTYLEIIHMLIASHVAIGVALAGGLVLTLWLWRLYRKLPPMTLRAELLHIGGGVAAVAVAALARGDSWQSVLSVSAIALLGAMGWNSSTALPMVETVKPASDADTEALRKLESMLIEFLEKHAPAPVEPAPPEHAAAATLNPASPEHVATQDIPVPVTVSRTDPPPVTLPTGANEVRP